MNEGRIRARRNKFSQISNSAIDTLGPVALWLYAKMYSKANIPGFILYKKVLENEARENHIGKERFNRAWTLLIRKGYLKQYRMQNDKGHFYYEYEVLEEPEEDPEELLVNGSAKQPESYSNECPEDQAAAAGRMKEVAPAQQRANTPHTCSPVPGYPYTGQPHTGQPVPGKQTPNNNINNNTKLNNTISSSSTTKYKYTKADEDELAIIPAVVQRDPAYNDTAILATIEEVLEYKPNKNDLKRILSAASSRYHRKDRSSGKIQKPFAYFLEILTDTSRKKTGDTLQSGNQSNTPNRFHNFHQRNYDFDQLEKDLLAAQW